MYKPFMVKKLLAALLLGFAGLTAGGQQLQTPAWQPDNGDGTYSNPVLYADYSDPDVIRVGKDYYMTASSFHCLPGLPILHSRDMVNWQLVNHALPQLGPDSVFNKPQHGKGVWAPSFCFHNKTFYIYYPDPDMGIYMIKTINPAKEWSAPVLVLPGKGIIDPSVLWDDNGQAYMAVAWAASRAGVNSLLTIFKLNSRGDSATDRGKHVFDGHGADHTVEGPKLYKKNGWYYIFCPAGGVATGWQLALRSKSVYGPYERKLVLQQGATAVNGPHQGALVSTTAGQYWFFHFQDKGAYGRVVWLEPVVWQNGWPVMGNGTGEPVATARKPVTGGPEYPPASPAVNDEFNRDTLGLQWQWQANPQIQWYALLRNTGYLRLFAWAGLSGPNLWFAPNLLLQKFPAPSFTAVTKLTWHTEWNVYEGKKADLVVMGNNYATLYIQRNQQGWALTQSVCVNAAKGGGDTALQTVGLQDSTVYLRVTVKAPEAQCVFGYSTDNVHFTAIGPPFMARPDAWTGSKVGIFATSENGVRPGGYADFGWFRIFSAR